MYKIQTLLLMLFFGLFASINAQKFDTSKIIFGKTYSKEELKEMNGVIRCASSEYEKYLQEKYPDRMTDAQFENWLAPLIEKGKVSKSQNGNIITIPVVVHVIHSGQPVGTAPNITDNQVISQITVMNQDFRKMAGTPGYNTNAVGADTQIQFALAKVDPNGNPTNGIDRVNICYFPSVSQSDMDGYVKPKTIWDPTKYMNMWSVKFSNTSLLGYAQFPSNSTLAGLGVSGGLATTDGVVANYATFGSSTYNDGTFLLSAPYDKGRTMTHEVGHFLGLRHIWGDANCGTDYCADTPTAHTSNGSCNTSIASCDAGLFEMVQNYMDYTPDTCMNIFTVDQTSRITTVMNNSPRRVELKTSTADVAIPLFPNDAEVKLSAICSLVAGSCTPQTGLLPIQIYNWGTSNLTSATITYSVNGGTTQTYNWTGNLSPTKFAEVNITVPANIPTGNIVVTVTQANGVPDQRASNNTATGIYYNNSAQSQSYNLTSVVFNLQLDYWGSETTWSLKDGAGTTLYSGGPYADTSNYLPAIISQTWNLTPNTCYVLTVNDSFGDGICCESGSGYFNLKSPNGTITLAQGGQFPNVQSFPFNTNQLGTEESSNSTIQIFPNPATDVLNITKVSDKATYKIYNMAGQLVSYGKVKNNLVQLNQLIKGTYVISVFDQDNEVKLKFIKK